MSSYYLDDNSTDLDALQSRLETTDLIPSQLPLMVSITDKMNVLRSADIASMGDLRRALKDSKSLKALSEKSGIDPEYLNLLRRTVNGFFPKPRSLKEMDWVDQDAIAHLKNAGITNTRQFLDAISVNGKELAKDVGVDGKDMQELAAISDLCRVRWVSPSFARAIVAAGVNGASALAEADPEALCQAIADANRNADFYKGKVGLRDIRRLVAAAAHVP